MRLLNQIWDTIKSLFTFSAQEKRGASVLLGIIYLILGITIFSSQYTKGDQINIDHDTVFSNIHDTIFVNKNIVNRDTLFYFDPNNATIKDFQKLGFSLKQSQSIINYREAGKVFKTVDDFAKSYVVSDSMFKRLKPYIKIIPQKKDVSLFEFDPNSVSKEELTTLGFSPKQAQAIINYRNAGKKFRVAEDFAKSYVVSDSMFQRLKKYIKIKNHSENSEISK